MIALSTLAVMVVTALVVEQVYRLELKAGAPRASNATPQRAAASCADTALAALSLVATVAFYYFNKRPYARRASPVADAAAGYARGADRAGAGRPYSLSRDYIADTRWRRCGCSAPATIAFALA
ncbi:hypothetical protein ACU4GD_19520 [Cupriavidus basilensis]